MCGIIGYIGEKNCKKFLFQGLKKLEYRGYDSSGIGIVKDAQVHVVKSEGKLSQLEKRLDQLIDGSIGMGHTRWATHGEPTTTNAHPHQHDFLTVIHNGIIENYQELKAFLLAQKYSFTTETDTEVMLKLMHFEIEAQGDYRKGLLSAIDRLEGAFSVGILNSSDPNGVYVFKQGSPVVIGLGEGENYFASDALTIREHTDQFIFLHDGEAVYLTKDKIETFDFQGAAKKLKVSHLPKQVQGVDKGGYAHFMLKEIHEQAYALPAMLARFVDLKTHRFLPEPFSEGNVDFEGIHTVHIVACGTAYLSGMVAKYFMEQKLKVSVNVELASEFRYRKPFLDAGHLIIAMTQSGETADTLAVVRYGKEKNCQVLAICNVPYSSIPRAADQTVYLEVGPEIGVASTKAFTAMIFSLYLWTLKVSQEQKLIDQKEFDSIFHELKTLPIYVDEILAKEDEMQALAEKVSDFKNCLFIGRGLNYPIALEGALKLKEISYIHAEGYAAGELKHGPIALIDQKMLTVAIAPKNEHYDKVISNIEEIKARKGVVLGIGTFHDEQLENLSDYAFTIPAAKDPCLEAILTVIPLQLFAYFVALDRGTDIDQPRNLAKSVTVE